MPDGVVKERGGLADGPFVVVDPQAHRGMSSRRRASSAVTNVVCPAASRAFRSRMAAVSSASSSSCAAADRSRARRRRKSSTGTTAAAWPPRWITSYEPCPDRGLLAGRSSRCLLMDDRRGLDIYSQASGLTGTMPPLRHPMSRRKPEPGAERRMLIRTLALLTRFRGAKRGANDRRFQAPSGHAQPLPLRMSGTSGHIQHYEGTLRKCLLSSRSRVRVAVGAQVRLLIQL